MLGGALARTVSDAGAFGMLGFDEGETAESLAEQLAKLRGGNAPVRFGIGLVRWALDLAIAAKPAFVSISLGDPTPYVERFHDAGILVGAQVQSRAWARTALAAGVDILTAQGTEAGGHTGSVGTLPLLQIVLEMAGDVPVIAAGGMATGRGLAAGASGAWIGTPFLVAREARSNDVARERIMRSDETQTVLTRAFHRVSQKAWPTEFPGRALRNAFTDRYHGREGEITMWRISTRDRRSGSWMRWNLRRSSSRGSSPKRRRACQPRRASRVVPTNWPLTNLRRGFSLRLQIVTA